MNNFRLSTRIRRREGEKERKGDRIEEKTSCLLGRAKRLRPIIEVGLWNRESEEKRRGESRRERGFQCKNDGDCRWLSGTLQEYELGRTCKSLFQTLTFFPWLYFFTERSNASKEIQKKNSKVKQVERLVRKFCDRE